MYFERYKQQQLDTGDIVYLESDQLAYVDSQDTTGTPTGLSSIPERQRLTEWSFDFNIKDDNRKAGLQKDGTLIDIQGNKVDKILGVIKLIKPVTFGNKPKLTNKRKRSKTKSK